MLISHIRDRLSPKFMRYIITGFTSLGVDYGSFVASYYLLGIPLKVSVFIGLALGFIVNFSMNKFWTFKASGDNSHHNPLIQLCLYSGLFVFNYSFTYFLIKFLQQQGVPPGFGKLFAVGFVTIWNYFVYKLAIFKENVGDTSTE